MIIPVYALNVVRADSTTNPSFVWHRGAFPLPPQEALARREAGPGSSRRLETRHTSATIPQ